MTSPTQPAERTWCALLLIAASLVLARPALAEAPEVPRLSVATALDRDVVPPEDVEPAWLRVAIVAGKPDPSDVPRRNLAFVVDRSAAVDQDTLDALQEALIAAVAALDPDDVVGIVTFGSTVEVALPSGRVGDGDAARRAIAALTPGEGGAALFAAVSKAAAEARKYAGPRSVDRVVLLSVGPPTQGPTSASDLGRLGQQLRRAGVPASAIGVGLGYQEDPLDALARESGGRHMFVEEPAALARVLGEGVRALSAVALEDVVVTVTFAGGFEPAAVLGRDGDLVGQRVRVALSDVLAGRDEDVIVAVRIAGVATGDDAGVATVVVTGVDPRTGARLEVTAHATVNVSPHPVEATRHTEVVERLVVAEAIDRSRAAILLRDAGKLDQARGLLQDNVESLMKEAGACRSSRLEELGRANASDAEQLEASTWSRRRKVMRARHHAPSYDGPAPL